MTEERKCCGTFEGTPHRNTCRPNMIKEIDRLTAMLAESEAEIKGLEEHLQLLREHHNKQLSASQQECERLSSVLGLREYTNHIRKQAAGEIVEFLSDLGLVSDASAIKAIRTRFGLEG